MLFSQR